MNNLQVCASLPVAMIDFGACYFMGHILLAGGYFNSIDMV